MNVEKEIINEEDVYINGKTYKEITYEDGEQILKRYNEKYKMWVILKFKPDDYDDTHNINQIKVTSKNLLINAIQYWIAFFICYN